MNWALHVLFHFQADGKIRMVFTILWLGRRLQKVYHSKMQKNANPRNTLARSSSARNLENQLFSHFWLCRPLGPHVATFFCNFCLELLFATLLRNALGNGALHYTSAACHLQLSFATSFHNFFSSLYFLQFFFPTFCGSC